LRHILPHRGIFDQLHSLAVPKMNGARTEE
jgi:hypothetical protein